MNLEDLPKEVWLVLGGLILVGIGVFVYKKQALDSTPPVEILATATASGQIASDMVYIDISGAVIRPGVYHLSPKSRVEDVLTLAGGLAIDADTKWFEIHINRAAGISDGMKIYIPRKNESPVKNEDLSVNRLINLNTASQTELEGLPGIGAVYAVKIITNRPYSRTEDLLTKKVVGDKLFSRIKDLITVW